MRIDFREERKWKIALAYNLAHAVMEWHEAGTLEERVRQGICVLWKRPREAVIEEEPDSGSTLHAFVVQEPDPPSGSASKGESTPVHDDNSDDDSDEEQERDQQDVIDALDPAIAVQEALEDAELLGIQPSQEIQPKQEDIEDTSALRRAGSENAMLVDRPSTDALAEIAPKDETTESSGLKSSSGNPMLGTHDNSNDSVWSSSKSKSKSSLYAPIREQIVYSELDKLFLDLDDLDLAKGMSSLSTDDPSMSASLPLPDLSEIFSDVQPLGLLDVVPASSSDGKKKPGRADKDDPHRRAEDTTYMKALPVNDFMNYKVTLLGPLHPSKHYHDGEWHDFDESAVVIDHDVPPSPIDENVASCEYRIVLSSQLD